MVNYYQVLQVRDSSNNKEIKDSFRKLVKKHHPDKNRSNGTHSEEKIKLLIEAYKTLTDSEKRTQYDQLLQFESADERPYFREKNEKGKDDLKVQAKQVLRDLLDKNGPQAVKDYERLQKGVVKFTLLKCLSIRDYLDCAFLLAEEYERQGKCELAFKLYEDVYQRELKNPARRFLHEEIKDRIIRLSGKKLLKLVQTGSAIAYLQRTLDLELSKVEKAFIYKKIADCYLKLGEWNSSIVNFDTAMSLHPNLKGTQTLRNKLYKHFNQQN